MYTVLDHLYGDDRIIVADGTEEFGHWLDVGRFAPFAFVNRVKTAGDALTTWVFFDESNGKAY
jgi:hypothetical protein